jgi:hypothetical protein
MNIPLMRIKPILHLWLWIFLVVGGWLLWSIFLVLDVWSYILPLTLGLGVGILSGLPPTRAFLACFFGFLVIGFLLSFTFSNVLRSVIIFGVLCGFFATAGAIIRRIFFRRGIEELYLNRWQWVSLIGGVTSLADYFTIPGAFYKLFVYHHVFSFVQVLVPVLIGLFALGLYAGSFYTAGYDELVKSVMKASLGAHGLFLAYRIYLLVTGSISPKSFVVIPLIGLYLVVLYKGAQMGYQLKNRKEESKGEYHDQTTR